MPQHGLLAVGLGVPGYAPVAVRGLHQRYHGAELRLVHHPVVLIVAVYGVAEEQDLFLRHKEAQDVKGARRDDVEDLRRHAAQVERQRVGKFDFRGLDRHRGALGVLGAVEGVAHHVFAVVGHGGRPHDVLFQLVVGPLVGYAHAGGGVQGEAVVAVPVRQHGEIRPLQPGAVYALVEKCEVPRGVSGVDGQGEPVAAHVSEQRVFALRLRREVGDAFGKSFQFHCSRFQCHGAHRRAVGVFVFQRQSRKI